jgi:transcriptional regulator
MTFYQPRHFSMTDSAAIRRALDEYAFATLVTTKGADVLLSHVPVLVDASARGAESPSEGPSVVIGHVAAANPHAAALADGTSFLMFMGPYGYVSPNWYTAPAQAVPTWNYVAIHLHGAIERVDTPEGKRAIVDALSARHESAFRNPWTSD